MCVYACMCVRMCACATLNITILSKATIQLTVLARLHSTNMAEMAANNAALRLERLGGGGLW